jgi:iron complex transport system substrate-binding protein
MSPRRSLRFTVPLVVITLVAVACGSKGSSREGSGGGGDQPPASEAKAVTIEHRYGSVTIDEPPKRVVTVGLTDQDSVLALGVVPIGATEWFGGHPGAIWPWAKPALGAAKPPEIVGDTQTINFEKIAALQPDVITALYAGLTKKDYETLSAIAPTVAQPKEYVDFGIPWDEQTLTIGRILGREAKAKTIVDGIKERFVDVRAEHPDFEGATGLVATPYQGTVSVYAPEDGRGRFLASLGFAQPEEIAKLAGSSFSADLSLERLDLLNVDVLVWILDDIESNRAEMEKEALYTRLPVHTGGREVFVANPTELGGATSFVTVLSLPILLDQLVPKIAAALDGDPAPPVPTAG